LETPPLQRMPARRASAAIPGIIDGMATDSLANR
jgi:hypothetical protein